MFCKFCGKALPDNAIFCAQCGKQLMLPVSNTNVSSTSETQIVSYTPVYTPPIPSMPKKTKYVPTESSKSRLVAALLAFFFGDLGVHRFYVGRVFSGFIQMLLGLSFIISLIMFLMIELELAVLTFLLGIIWGFWVFIDFILILCGTFKDKDGLPITDWGL